jgi:high affinity Mn2+ porin
MPLRRRRVVAALAAVLLVGPAWAAEPAPPPITAAEFASLLRRVEELEAARCTSPQLPTPARPGLATRVEVLETAVAAFEPAAHKVNGWAGVELGADLLYVGQQFASGNGGGRYANYRLDGSLHLPAGHGQRASGSFFLHARAGQSPAPTELPASFSGLNATAFQLGGTSAPEDAALTLTEAWYQLDYPSTARSADGEPRHLLSLTLGKLDPFVFFDQNAYANDEATQFLSAPFVHSALLDNPLAAQIGTDAYGASPGLRLGYAYRGDRQRYALDWGHFASGEDANYTSALDRGLDLLQFEWQTQLAGRPGSYRLLAFRNQAGPGFDGSSGETRGWSLSFDQQASDLLALFLRHGEARGEQLPFDRSTALGVEFAGSAWSRADDRLGIGVARLHASRVFREQAGSLDAYGYLAGGAENLIELYYRYLLTAQLHASLHLQHLHEPGANAAHDALNVLSLRLGASY